MTTTDNWKVDADGDWSNASDWSAGAAPTSNSVVTISTTDVHTVTHSTGSDIVDKLTVGQDYFDLTGGSLQVLTSASFADGFDQFGGTLQAGSISITGPAMLMGGASEGSTSFSVNGVTTLSNYTLGAASQLAVSGTADQTNQITLGDANGVGAAIKVASNGTYDIAGDFGIGQGAASGAITNAGLLEKGAGAGTSTISSSVTNTGTLSAITGTLQLAGPTNTIGGTLAGGGQIAFEGGVTTLNKASVTVANLGLYNSATLNLGYSFTLKDVLTVGGQGNTTLNIGAYTLKLEGSSSDIYSNYGGALVTGSGAFQNVTALTLGNGNSAVTFGGTLSVQNYRTISQAGQVTLGDGSGDAPAFTNETGAVYDFTNDSNLSENGTTVGFDNLGTIEKTGSGGTSSLSVAVVNAGTISAQSGTLQFTNSLTNTGAISGSGTVQITGGAVANLNAGTTLGVAALAMYNNTTLNVNTALTYAGTFTDSSNGPDDLNLAANLTLTGKSNVIAGYYGPADISGTGVLANQGTLTLGGNSSVVVDGSTEIDNTGTINQAFTVTIGGGGGQVASVVNASGATYNLVGGYTINNGAAAASHFDNSGVFNVNTGTGAATLATTFDNEAGGVMNIAVGTLVTTGILNNSGAIDGTQLALESNSETYLNSGTALNVQQFDMYNFAGLTLGTNVTYAGQFVDASDGTTTINLDGHNLVLTGASSFSAAYGSANVIGPGILYIDKAGHISEGNSSLIIGGTAEFEIAAAETVTGQVQVGDGGSDASTMVITSKGVYDFTADAGISRGQSTASLLTNSGLFEKTSGTGTSEIDVDFVNDGTITVTSGTIEFTGGFTNAGKINGKETTNAQGDVFITAASASGHEHTDYGSGRPSTASAQLRQAAAAFAAPESGLAEIAWGTATGSSPLLAAPHFMRA